ncbi:hypothetical protein [Roseibium aggregatum]|uniref:hypothetical protein n=1 Tax=Roseibium aggregatum TaxID=187304 RepID=UPI001A8C1C7F|nr:hypothetical protein [Roseibium aggregatum]MBN8182014.1 hypothetical protein [Roseibium aggregatum]
MTGTADLRRDLRLPVIFVRAGAGLGQPLRPRVVLIRADTTRTDPRRWRGSIGPNAGAAGKMSGNSIVYRIVLGKKLLLFQPVSGYHPRSWRNFGVNRPEIRRFRYRFGAQEAAERLPAQTCYALTDGNRRPLMSESHQKAVCCDIFRLK